MKLDPGIYKIKKKGEMFRFEPRYHYLVVYIRNNKKYIKMDHGLPEVVNSDDENWVLEGYQIVKTISNRNKVEYRNLKVLFEWEDEDNHPIKMQVRTWSAMQNLFKSFPGIMKTLGIKRKII